MLSFFICDLLACVDAWHLASDEKGNSKTSFFFIIRDYLCVRSPRDCGWVRRLAVNATAFIF